MIIKSSIIYSSFKLDNDVYFDSVNYCCVTAAMDDQYTLTFEKAFRGKYTTLCGRIDSSYGLFNQLRDRDVLTSQQVSTCQVVLSTYTYTRALAGP